MVIRVPETPFVYGNVIFAFLIVVDNLLEKSYALLYVVCVPQKLENCYVASRELCFELFRETRRKKIVGAKDKY